MKSRIYYEIIETIPSELNSKNPFISLLRHVLYFTLFPFVTIYYFFINPSSILVFLKIKKRYTSIGTEVTPLYYPEVKEITQSLIKVNFIYGRETNRTLKKLLVDRDIFLHDSMRRSLYQILHCNRFIIKKKVIHNPKLDKDELYIVMTSNKVLHLVLKIL